MSKEQTAVGYKLLSNATISGNTPVGDIYVYNPRDAEGTAVLVHDADSNVVLQMTSKGSNDLHPPFPIYTIIKDLYVHTVSANTTMFIRKTLPRNCTKYFQAIA